MFSLYSLEGQGNIFNDLEFMRGALFERKHWLLSKLIGYYNKLLTCFQKDFKLLKIPFMAILF